MAVIRIALPLVVVMCCVLLQSTSALIHVVGGTAGWGVPPNATFYTDWAKPRTFGAGDKLVFPYRVGAHNVLQVNKPDFDKCGHDNVVNMFYKGPTVFQLNATGDYYFYSGIGTHCELGQKLHVHVVPGRGYSGRGTRFLEVVVHALAPSAPHNSAPTTTTTALPYLGLFSCLLLVVLLI
ncbi:hypothetical protein BVRB_5g099420 [Beta vulgaris subsp. vulgaris]|nr:hypothetical protein BVRB_5g099420 [Beta vulgaris subsp. vulgaris]